MFLKAIEKVYGEKRLGIYPDPEGMNELSIGTTFPRIQKQVYEKTFIF